MDKKIYIVLTHTNSIISKMIKLFTKDKYSHISLSFNSKCNKMYSFSRKYSFFPFYGIFKIEDIRKGLFKNNNSIIAIYELNVTNEQYNNIINKIDEISHSNKGYNIIGLLLAYFKIKLHRKKYYCSEFVYEVLSNDNIHVISNEKNLFKPEEIICNNSFKKIFEGKILDYIAIC